jgi:molybdopterin-guanine dinucleotide biosynthesis protein A
MTMAAGAEKGGLLPVTGVLMAGGRSRRMGQAKAFLPGREKTLIEDTLEVMAGLFPEILISGSDPRLSTFGYRALADEMPGRGPLGGLCTVLRAAAHEYVFLAACDLPFFCAEAVRELWRRGREEGPAGALIPMAGGRLHPLHAFYSREILPLLTFNLERGNLKINRIFADAPGMLRVTPFTGEFADFIATNVNTPEEYAEICALPAHNK